MTTDFPYVEVPKELVPLLGKPEPGTRVYRKSGSQEEMERWFDAVCNAAGGTVSPGGVSMFAPVTRAAVYKRISDGKLTVFFYHVERKVTTLFGRNKIKRESPYMYIPVVEAKAWGREIEERAIAQGTITREELERAKAGGSRRTSR